MSFSMRLGLSLAACPGDMDTPAGVRRVVATTPADLADDGEPAGAVQAVFSMDMDPASIDETSFVVESGGAPVAGQVSYDAATRTASFVPDERLPLLGGATATITIATTSADGVPLAEEHTWSFAVRDGVWGAPVELGAEGATDPVVARDAAGNAIAVWTQDGGGCLDLWAARYTPDGGWSAPQLTFAAVFE
jgi:hypothetical protein